MNDSDLDDISREVGFEESCGNISTGRSELTEAISDEEYEDTQQELRQDQDVSLPDGTEGNSFTSIKYVYRKKVVRNV